MPAEYVGPSTQTQEGSYGYVRTIDGTATVLQADGERVRAQANEPLLVGDQVWVSVGSRVELLLADRNLVRLDGGAELRFEALAYSADRNDPGTVLDLRRGKLQLVVDPEYIGSQYPAIRTPNASIVLRGAGSYLVLVDERPRTELIVRSGAAEVRSEGDAAEVRAGEELVVSGAEGAMRFASARGLDRLEEWGESLMQYAEGEYRQHVDTRLAYAAAPLDRYGSWVRVGARWGWRPHAVSAGWRPYWHGRWRYTPSGLFWVSYEPWGWVPYHYGTWDWAFGFGWVWYPGHYFSPAHVYWYWGPRYAGWIPSGYYWHHYRRRYGYGFGYYFGTYGYVGGGWGPYRYWNFCDLWRVGNPRQHRYVVTGFNLEKRDRSLARGILTTDTRRFTPERWQRPAELLRVATEDGRTSGRRDLPDANPFVHRVPKLPGTLERLTVDDGRGADSRTAARQAPGPNIESRRRTADLQRPGLERPVGPDRLGTPERRTPELRTPSTTPRETPTLRRPETGARSAPELRRPNSTPRETPTLRRPETGARSAPELRRPNATPRETPTLRRPNSTPRETPTLRRPETGARSTPELRRPNSTPRETPTIRRPNTTPRETPALRRPESSSRSTPTLRRPSSTPRSTPTVRRPNTPSRSTPTLRRPEVNSRSSPTLRRPSSSSRSTPSVRRPETSSRSSPTVRRPSSSSRSTPSVRRPSTSSRSTPSVRRPSTPTRRAPTVRAPTVRRAPTARPRPSPRRSPTVRRGGRGGGGD